MFARLPVKKLSRQTTSLPSETNRSQRCEPRKPAPPVTRMRSGAMAYANLPDRPGEEEGLRLSQGNGAPKLRRHSRPRPGDARHLSAAGREKVPSAAVNPPRPPPATGSRPTLPQAARQLRSQPGNPFGRIGNGHA